MYMIFRIVIASVLSLLFCPANALQSNWKMLVVSYSGHEASVSTEYLEDRFFNESIGVTKFFSKISYGHLNVSGDVLEKNSFPIGKCTVNFIFNRFNLSRIIKSVPSSILNNYDSVMFIIPPGTNCLGDRAAGRASFGKVMSVGDGKRVAYAFVDALYADTLVVEHELGHNLGLKHSSTPGNVYGNPYSVMGNRLKGHVPVSDKHFLGWIKEGDGLIGVDSTVVDSLLDGSSDTFYDLYTMIDPVDTKRTEKPVGIYSHRGGRNYYYIERRRRESGALLVYEVFKYRNSSRNRLIGVVRIDK